MSDSQAPDHNFRPIPKLFFSDLTGAPMDHCISCERPLLDGSIPYFIEKALKPNQGYKLYSTIFEYAMCLPCMDSHKGKISKKSMLAINQYFMNQVDLERRQYLVEEELYDDLDLWVGRCLVKDTDVRQMSECQLYAMCINDQIVMAEHPYMVSGLALDEVVDLLSDETLDEFNRLTDELIGPSEFQDLLKGGPRVLL